MADKKRAKKGAPLASGRDKAKPTAKKEAKPGSHPAGQQLGGRELKAAADGKHKPKSGDLRAATSKKRVRLTIRQRELLVRISEADPQGLNVGDKQLQRTITSLLGRGLIRQTESGAERTLLRCHLSEAGAQYVSSMRTKEQDQRKAKGLTPAAKAPKSKPREIAYPTEREFDLTAGAQVALDVEEEITRGLEPLYIPTPGDIVTIRRNGLLDGQLGRVNKVSMKQQKACVCLCMTDDEWVPMTFDFDQLKRSNKPIVDGSCEDCKDWEDD
jgi:hypothetical protein